ncbi:MAG: helix-turn-helix transcriptional regulator [Leptolyngbyaceae cyanobacterium]
MDRPQVCRSAITTGHRLYFQIEDRRVLDTKLKPPKSAYQLVPFPAASASTALVPPALTMDYLSMLFKTFLDTVFPHQGFMLLDGQGNLIQSSPYADHLSQQMTDYCESGSCQTSLWAALRTLVECLIESRQLFPGEHIQLRDEVTLTDGTQVSIEAEWVELDGPSTACVVVTLKIQTVIAHLQASCEAFRHGLTERETEVWQHSLLGLSYSAIGQKLFISINTVKQHMKRIYQKLDRSRQ